MTTASARLFSIASLSFLMAFSLQADTESSEEPLDIDTSSVALQSVGAKAELGISEAGWSKQPRINRAVGNSVPDSFRVATVQEQMTLQLELSEEGMIRQAKLVKVQTQR